MKITYVVLICVTMLSCQFPLKEENNVILPSKPKNNIKIDLLNFPDTLNLIENTTVSYSLNVGGSTPIAVFIAIGKEAQYFGYAPNGAFVLSNTNDQIQAKGYLPFEFAVFSTSGTGSLADRSQRELLLFSVKRILYFDYSSTKAINFTKTEVVDGSIFLSWEKYPNRNLRSLWLQRKIYAGGVESSDIPIYLPKDATTYHEDAFLGSQVEYELHTENNFGVTAIGLKTQLASPTPKIVKFKSIGVNQLLITWTKVHLYNNSRGYQLVNETGTLFSTADPSDTSAVLSNVPFGGGVSIRLETLSKSSFAYNLNATSKVWVGDKIPTPKLIIADPLHTQTFYLNAPYLTKEQPGKRDSTTLSFDNSNLNFLSADGSTIYLTSGTSILELATSNLALQNTYAMPAAGIYSFVPYNTNFITALPVGASFSYVKVFDKASGVVEQNYPLTEILGSSSSKNITFLRNIPVPGYILGEGGDIGLFKVNADGTIASSKYVPGEHAMLSKDGNYLYVFTQNIRQKYTFPDLEIVTGAEATVPYFDFESYDRAKGLIGVRNGSNYTVVDLETLNAVKQVPLNGPIDITIRGGVLYYMATSNLTYKLSLNL